MESQDGTTDTWDWQRVKLVISQPVLGVVLFTYEGHMTADVIPFIERTFDRVLAQGVRPDLFIDVERMTGYDSDYRQAVSRWGTRIQSRSGEHHFFVRSRLVAMGIAVSNLAAGGKLQPTTKRPEFEAALARAIARHSSAGR
jgi:hypothetical protein